ncbi:hypothetical protein AVEN_61795-1 [Araneus ventricosus]|uniref:Uncharacterized protein n=1 Tax=Araneus ventricosus TaxID=182803 RepID=A0A4Y2PS60_ARAVE|nr:hypothetical protein AVEN_61795-1 [Araneus ventricosus]
MHYHLYSDKKVKKKIIQVSVFKRAHQRTLGLSHGHLLYYRHEKSPGLQTCMWRASWKRDIPLHFGDEGKGLISFGEDRTDGSLVSLCTTVENGFLA